MGAETQQGEEGAQDVQSTQAVMDDSGETQQVAGTQLVEDDSGDGAGAAAAAAPDATQGQNNTQLVMDDDAAAAAAADDDDDDDGADKEKEKEKEKEEEKATAGADETQAIVDTQAVSGTQMIQDDDDGEDNDNAKKSTKKSSVFDDDDDDDDDDDKKGSRSRRKRAAIDSDDEDEGSEKKKEEGEAGEEKEKKNDDDDDDDGEQGKGGDDDEQGKQKGDEKEGAASAPRKRIKKMNDSDDDDDDKEDKEDKDADDSKESKESKAKSTKNRFGDSESDDDNGGPAEKQTSKKPSDAAQQKLQNIFGDDSDDEGDFQGFSEADLAQLPKPKPDTKAKAKSVEKKDKDAKSKSKKKNDDEEEEKGAKDGPMSDFDLMMEKKKSSRGGSRKEGEDVGKDYDRQIQQLIRQMETAYADDVDLMEAKQPATKKLKLLPTVSAVLQKHYLREYAMDNHILKPISLWLRPFGRILPSLPLRNTLIPLVKQFSDVEKDELKDSQIGKVVMQLLHHPGETRENKEILRFLVEKWSRDIMKLTDNYSQLKGDEKRELEANQQPTLAKARRRSSTEEDLSAKREAKPGEAGFIVRARVPQATPMNFTQRPKSEITDEIEKRGKKVTKIEKFARRNREARLAADRNKLHAQGVSLSGTGL